MAKKTDKTGSLELMHKDVISHDIDVIKYEEKIKAKAQKNLGNLQQELVGEVANNFPGSELNPKKRIIKGAAVTKAGNKRIKEAFGNISKLSEAELRDLAQVESQFKIGLVNKFAGGKIATEHLSKVTLRNLVDTLSIQGAPSAKWWARQSTALQSKFTDLMFQGVQNNWTNEQMIEALRGTEAAGFRNGLMRTTEVQAEALVRTSVQTVTNSARLATLSANADVIDAIQWVSTLDLRTSSICKGLSGKKWQILTYKPLEHGTPFPGPTAHWRCRSTQVPITKKWSDLPTKKQALVSSSAKANMGDALLSPVTFSSYLKGLSDKQLLSLFKDEKIVRQFKRGKLSDANALRFASKQPIDKTTIQHNLKQLGLSGFDDISEGTFAGQSLYDAEALIVGAPNEIALISKNNKIIKVINGNAAEVEFDWFTRKDLYNNVVTHNHGAASSFSTADIKLFFDHNPKQFRVVMPVTDIQSGFLGATTPTRYATIVLEKIDNGPDIKVSEIMRKIKEEREIYFKSITDAGDNLVVNETQARFGSYVALKRVADDVPGFRVRTEFSNGKIGIAESIDDVIAKVTRERGVTVVEPETIILTRAKKLGLDVDNDIAAEVRVRGLVKEMFPGEDSFKYDLADAKNWTKIQSFVKKNKGVDTLPLNQFEAGMNFEAYLNRYAWDIRDAGGPSNRAWAKESIKHLFAIAKVDVSDSLRALSIQERVAIQKVLDTKPIAEAFGFEQVQKATAAAISKAKLRNTLAKEKAVARISDRQETVTKKINIAFKEEAITRAARFKAVKEKLARAKLAGNVERQLLAEAELAELDTFTTAIGQRIKAPKKATKFKPVPRFKNEKQISSAERINLDQQVRRAQGKPEPVRDSSILARDKANLRYDAAYEDFTHLDVDEFDELLASSMRGTQLSEHEALVINRGIAASSSRYSLIPDGFAPKSFAELLEPANKRKFLVNYQAHINIDKKLKRVKDSNIFRKAPVDPITGEAITTSSEEVILSRLVNSFKATPVFKKGNLDYYLIGKNKVSPANVEALINLIDEGKYIVGRNRMEPAIQTLLTFANKDFDWSKIKNFKATINGTKTTPGILFNKTLQYVDKLVKVWDEQKQVSLNTAKALAKKSEAGVNTVSKRLLVDGTDAVTATKMTNREAKLIRYHNLNDSELLIHNLVNKERLKLSGIKEWNARIKHPHQSHLIARTADNDLLVLEPSDLRLKAFKDISVLIKDQRTSKTIAEVNDTIGNVVLDARIYKKLKASLTGKVDMSDYLEEWTTKSQAGSTNLNLFEYGLQQNLNKLAKLPEAELVKLYAKANTKLDDAYRVSLKSPKRALSLNNLDDQLLTAEAQVASSSAAQARTAIQARGLKAAREIELSITKTSFEGSTYGKELAHELIVEANKLGTSFDPVSARLSTWVNNSRWAPEELSDRIVAAVMNAELSRGQMGPAAHKIGSLLAKGARVDSALPEAYIQVGARVLAIAERKKWVRRYKAPLLNAKLEPIRGLDGKFKEAWYLEVIDDDLRKAALNDPKLRRFSDLPQLKPAAFDIESPWEYVDGTSVAKIRNKELLETVYSDPTTSYRQAIIAKNETAFKINENTFSFFEKLRATGLKNSHGESVIPAWDLSIQPKSAAGLTLRSKTAQWNNIHSAARSIKGDPQFYYKFTSDFRGRTYPSGVLTPQGGAQAKAYLRFKNPTAIRSKENADHFWTELAARSGNDKLPKTKGAHEDWALVKRSYGSKAAKNKMTVQDHGYEVDLPEFAKIWDDTQSGKFWKDPKARLWLDKYEEEWPEVFAAAEEVAKMRKHVEAKLGTKIFKVGKDGTYKVTMPKAQFNKAILDYKPELIPHIDGTTNAYQQMAMITRDEVLGQIANLGSNKKLYDAYYYTGLTIAETDEAIIAAALRNKNFKLYEKALKANFTAIKKAGPDSTLSIVGDWLKVHNFSEFDRTKRQLGSALKSKANAVKAMPEVFGKNATVSMSDLRPLFKKPVMLQPYGASTSTILSAIRTEGIRLAKKDPKKFGFLLKDDNVKLLGKAIMDMNPIFYPKAREYQGFLVDLVGRYNRGRYNAVTGKYVKLPDGRPDPLVFEFRGPSGIRVRLDYRIQKDVPVEVQFGKESGWLTTSIHTDKIDTAHQARSVAANVTHAHDAAWDHIWTRILKEQGVKNFVGIHDAAGTDFGNMEALHKAWRQAGVELYQDYDLFDELLKQAEAAGVDIRGLTPPKKGSFNVKDILESPYAIH